MATVGVSVEQAVVRGVVLAEGVPGIVVHSEQRPLREGAVGAAITGLLDGFADELGPVVEDVAIVYRSVAERRSIVSQLAAGKWASSSLVSDRSALAVLTGADRELADAAARGAALIAAERLRELPVVAPSNGRRNRRLLLGAAAVATLLGAFGIAVAQILDDHPSEAVGRAASPPPSTPPAAIPSAPITIESAPPTTPAVEPTPQQIAPIAPTRPPARRTPSATASASTTETMAPTGPGSAPPTATTTPIAPPAVSGSTTPESPTSTTVGAPDGNWLFPGESPPPPLNVDPEVIRAWWANHWMLKERWLRGG
ncbi:hypothetical protein [Nocardia sp. CA-135398]|uniref:hypothetical protein n=1 Tax=Nocardia sp. CA-135398 TaxID=3239977 RepID=UPI003D95193C